MAKRVNNSEANIKQTWKNIFTSKKKKRQYTKGTVVEIKIKR